MTRLLLTIFGVGLVVAVLCGVGVNLLGGYHNNHWGWRGPDWDGDDMDWSWGYHDKPAGPEVTRDLAWPGGTSLTFNVPAVVHYTQGPETKITVSGPQAWVSKLAMQGDTLTMTGDIDLHGEDKHGLTIAISAPGVRRFELNSAQKLEIRDYSQDDLDIQSNGAAQIKAYGSAKTLRLQMNGAGQANLRHLVNQDADVEMNGAGQATLAATNSVKVEINGLGQTRLINQPKSLNQQIHGFGHVEVDEGDDSDADDDDSWTPPAPPAPPVPPTPPVPRKTAAATA